MKKILLIIISTLGLLNIAYAQLNKLCPISSTVYDKEKIKGMNLLLNTKDFFPILVPGRKTTRTSTVQLVRAERPFPPLWFQMGNPQSDTGGFDQTTFLLNPKIQKSSGNLTFFSDYPGIFTGSISFDTATLQAISATKKYMVPDAQSIMQYIDLHDFQTDAQGNKLFVNQVSRNIDVRCLSGLEKDSAEAAVVNEIIILDAKDSVIFRWDPLKHMSPCDMYWEYRNSSLMHPGYINWSHANSVKFANDGNIIYSFRHIGLGKINRQTGEIMWRLGGKNPDKRIALADSAKYYLEHDFLQRENGLYTVFSNGDSSHKRLEALVYKIDEVNKKAVLVNRCRPNPEIYSNALGNYDCHGDTCVLNFGINVPAPPAKPKPTQKIANILVGKKIVAELSSPVLNFAYQIKQTKWAAIQRRPKVTLQKGVLTSDSLEGLHDYIWYKIENLTAKPLAAGKIYTPVVSGEYVVVAMQGTDLMSYLVSDIFVFMKKGRN